MSVITPTITTDDQHEYRNQMERVASFAEGVHIDFADGLLAPTKLLPLELGWRVDELITHVHIMYQKPLQYIDDIINLEADLVILHAESEQVKEALKVLVENGTRTGICLLPETSVNDLQELYIDGLFEHVLLFGGHLGYQGGVADLSQLSKIPKLKELYEGIEIGWDGGVNDGNIAQIEHAGVSVINVGGYIKSANDPKKAYDTLRSLLS